jgi:SAM-dependent methyltransferase
MRRDPPNALEAGTGRQQMLPSARLIRTGVFAKPWPLDEDIRTAVEGIHSHRFLANPASQYAYVYLTRFVKALSEAHFHRSFRELAVLDWGCGKGHVSKLVMELEPETLISCDIRADREDSAFGQETPIIDRFGIDVTPLEHEYLVPFGDSSFDVVLSVGVLEHVANDRASLAEINRILKPGGLFFCFFLPTELSWTQKLSHLRGDRYHDRLYSVGRVKELLAEAGMELVDLWYRQLLPKNSVRYPNFRLFERFDQLITEFTPLRYFATNIEFVCVRPPLPLDKHRRLPGRRNLRVALHY